MNERHPDLGRSGQNPPVEPAVARALLAWIGGLTGSGTLKELARRAKLSSRTLARFAAGTAARGGHKTLASLLGALPLLQEVALGLMLPTLRTVRHFWSPGAPSRKAIHCALELAAGAVGLELLARQAEDVIEKTGSRKTPTALHPTDARVLIDVLQALGDWSRRDLARRADISHEALRLYADGEWPLERPVVQSLAAGLELPSWLMEGLMLPAIRAVRQTAAHPRRSELAAGWKSLSKVSLFSEGLHPLGAVAGYPEPVTADRGAAAELWWRLQSCGVIERILMVKNLPEFHSWAVVECLCTASREAATDSAKKALHLALLALRAARRLRTEARFALQLEGFALVHVANAWRVLGRLQRADKTYTRGCLFWQAGRATRFPLLPGWRVLDLGGSLRRDQRRFAEAINLLDRAREIAPREFWARILLKKATVLDQQGEPTAALSTLEEASAFLDPAQDPALYFRWRFLMGAELCHLGRYQEAQDLMPETIALGLAHGGALDRVRVEGLRGRIAAGLGHREEALMAFTAVRKEFHRLGMAYDYALLSLEAGEILLQEGRYDEVEALALEMEWIFRTEGISAEAEKALDLFRKAAAARTATPELAGKVVRFLVRAQHDPELRFAA